MVELRHADDDAVADADVLGLHRAGGEEQLRRRAVRVLLEEVVLDAPHLVEAELVGEPHLLERVHVDGALGLARPRPRHGELVEDAEFTGGLLRWVGCEMYAGRGPRQAQPAASAALHRVNLDGDWRCTSMRPSSDCDLHGTPCSLPRRGLAQHRAIGDVFAPAPQFGGIAMLDDSNGVATAAGGFLRTTRQAAARWAERAGRWRRTPPGQSACVVADGVGDGIGGAPSGAHRRLRVLVGGADDGGAGASGSVAAIGDAGGLVTGGGGAADDDIQAAEMGEVLHTTDGGATWSSVTSLLGLDYSQSHSLAAAAGCLRPTVLGEVGSPAYGAARSTVDGRAGATWHVPVREPALVPAEVRLGRPGARRSGASPRRTRVR